MRLNSLKRCKEENVICRVVSSSRRRIYGVDLQARQTGTRHIPNLQEGMDNKQHLEICIAMKGSEGDSWEHLVTF